MDERHLEALVEDICQRGCDAVDSIILELADDPPHENWAHLSPDERQLLQKELSDVMAVYKH